jgi:hypothetical protein
VLSLPKFHIKKLHCKSALFVITRHKSEGRWDHLLLYCWVEPTCETLETLTSWFFRELLCDSEVEEEEQESRRRSRGEAQLRWREEFRELGVGWVVLVESCLGINVFRELGTYWVHGHPEGPGPRRGREPRRYRGHLRGPPGPRARHVGQPVAEHVHAGAAQPRRRRLCVG